jgi:hypothetical protein
MKTSWRKTALWAGLSVGVVGSIGGVFAALGDLGPDVDAVYFALPQQEETGNPVECRSGSGKTLGLGYPIGIRLDGKGVGTWDIYVPLSGDGDGVAVAHGAPAPGGALAFAGTITVTDVAGDSNAVSFTSTFGVNGVIVKAGSGGDAQTASAYAYVRPPNLAALQALGWPNPENPYTGPISQDDRLDSPSNITQGISHVDFCIDPQPTVTKTADVGWKRWQEWQISKTVNGQESVGFDLDVGEGATLQYDVAATPINQRKRFRVEGEIVVSDPLNRGYALAGVTDTLDVGGNQFLATLADKGDFSAFTCAPVDDATTAIFHCAYAIELASAAYPDVDAGDTVVNKVDVTLSLNGAETQLSYVTPGKVFADTPDASYGDTLAVDDDLLPGTPNHTFPADGAWSYTMDVACPTPGTGQRINTVTGSYDTDNGPATVTDSAAANWRCFALPTVDKTAKGTAKREYTWEMTKQVTPTSVNLFDGDSHALAYTVQATRSAADDSIIVSGAITIRDAAERAFQVPVVTDVVSFGAAQFPVPGIVCTADGVAGNGIVFTCPYTVTIDPDAHPGVSFVNGSNHVDVSLTRADGSKTYALADDAAFVLGAPVTTGATLTVDDTMSGQHVFSESGAWQYPGTATCDPSIQTNRAFKIDNKATGTYTGGTPIVRTASVGVRCSTVKVTKTAKTKYTRDYDWAADKKVVIDPADARVQSPGTCLAAPIADGSIYNGFVLCDNPVLRLSPTGMYDTVYRLQATRTVESESAFSVYGSITASWSSTAPTPVFAPPAPSDTLHFTGGTTQSVTPTCNAMGATSLACTYSAPVGDKTAGYNLASITRPRLCFTSEGVSSACNGVSTYTSNQAAFSFGEPTTEIDKCGSMRDLFNDSALGLNLGAGFGWTVVSCMNATTTRYVTGTITNGTVVLGNLDIRASWIKPAQVADGTCTFRVPNEMFVKFGTQQRHDVALASVKVPKLCKLPGCTYTQGYWKTHVNYAAKPQFARKRDKTWDQIDGSGTLNENAPFIDAGYRSGYSYIQVMWTPPKGNAYYQLAHQYIAAKLNTHAGAGTTTQVATAIAEAEAMFRARINPNDAWWKNSANRSKAIALAGILGSYNEGAIGPGHCSVSPASLIAGL